MGGETDRLPSHYLAELSLDILFLMSGRVCFYAVISDVESNGYCQRPLLRFQPICTDITDWLVRTKYPTCRKVMSVGTVPMMYHGLMDQGAHD